MQKHTHTLTVLVLAALTPIAALGQVPDKFAHQADITIFPPDSFTTGFATAVSPLGDVNGDGFDDILVSSSAWNFNSGSVWIFFGSPAATFDPLNTIQFIGTASDQLGASIATNGDFDNDGVNDIMIGVPFHNLTQGPSIDEGQVLVFSGAPPHTFLAQWVGAGTQDFMGTRVTFFPNVDGVPGDEVLFVSEITGIGSYNSQMRHGVAVGSVIFTIPDIIVSNAGDVDLDANGISDIAVGLPNDSTAGANAGHIRYRRGQNGSTIFPDNIGPFGVAGEQLGSDVRFMGDVNNDTIDDVVASGVGFDSSRGRVHLISGVHPTHPDLKVFTGEAQGDQFGASIANMGDVTSNSVADVAIGAPFNDPLVFGIPTADAGRVYLYSSTTGELLRTFTGDVMNGHFGAVVSSAGDFNGDGVPDLAIAAPNTPTNPDGSSGAVYIFFLPQPCPGDLDGDNDVDSADLATLLVNWGNCSAPCPADLNGDGVVGSADLAALLANWGICTPPVAAMAGPGQTGIGDQTLLDPGAPQTQQAQSQTGDAFFLSIIGQFGFTDMQSYYDWLDLLNERELSAHILALIDAILANSK